MAPPSNKQAARKEKKAASKNVQDDEPVVTVSGAGALVEKLKELVMGSCLVQMAPQMPELLKDDMKKLAKETIKAAQKAKEKAKEAASKKNGNGEEKKENNGNGGAKEEEKEEEEEKKEDNGDTKEESDAVTTMFGTLSSKLAWHNALGLASPESAEESLKAWKAMKEQEVDFGPRAKRRGSPGTDRILANLHANMAQYFHLLLALMTLRALLLRSWFACLPWLVGYQNLSVFLPLDQLAMLPQVPLEKCPVKFRVAATIGLNALVWLFFALEVVYYTYFFEKIPLVGLFVYHAYAVRPNDK